MRHPQGLATRGESTLCGVCSDYFVLAFLDLAAFVVTIIAWFAILFTGRYPRGMFTFVVGDMRWCLRVDAYAFLLVTDVYPPFKLE